jgi:hypothetical protein
VLKKFAAAVCRCVPGTHGVTILFSHTATNAAKPSLRWTDSDLKNRQAAGAAGKKFSEREAAMRTRTATLCRKRFSRERERLTPLEPRDGHRDAVALPALGELLGRAKEALDNLGARVIAMSADEG